MILSLCCPMCSTTVIWNFNSPILIPLTSIKGHGTLGICVRCNCSTNDSWMKFPMAPESNSTWFLSCQCKLLCLNVLLMHRQSQKHLFQYMGGVQLQLHWSLNQQACLETASKIQGGSQVGRGRVAAKSKARVSAAGVEITATWVTCGHWLAMWLGSWHFQYAGSSCVLLGWGVSVLLSSPYLGRGGALWGRWDDMQLAGAPGRFSTGLLKTICWHWALDWKCGPHQGLINADHKCLFFVEGHGRVEHEGSECHISHCQFQACLIYSCNCWVGSSQPSESKGFITNWGLGPRHDIQQQVARSWLAPHRDP